MTISEKVAYLKGLAEGLAIDTEKSKEGKLTVALGEEIDALSDDLSEVEEAVFEEDDEDEDDDCCCEDDFFETECPNCGETLVIDASVLEEGVIQCPSCKEKFALDLSDECCDECCDDGCDCGCGCEHDHDEE